MLDAEGARRLVAARAELPLGALRASHSALIEDAERAMTPELPRRAILTDLTLHDALSTGLDNPLAAAAYAVNRDRIAVIQNTRPFLPDRIVPAMHEHLAIIDALERRDAEEAVAAIDAHYRTTLRWWGIRRAVRPRLTGPGTARRRGSAGCRTAARARPSRGRRSRWCGWSRLMIRPSSSP